MEKSTKTSKNKQAMLLFNYLYYFKRDNKDSTNWVCKDCYASITTRSGVTFKVNGENCDNVSLDVIKAAHDHEPMDDATIRKNEFRNDLKEQISAQPQTPIHQTYQKKRTAMIKELSDMRIVASNLPDFSKIKAGLYKHRQKNIPTIPKTIEEIQIPDEFKLCEDGKRRLLLHHSSEMIVFASDDGLSLLGKSTRWQSDGTFKCVPAGFYQLYIIHAWYQWKLIPCVFALLTNKEMSTYKKLIQVLKDAALSLGEPYEPVELKPQHVITDFEKAAMSVYKYHFPKIHVSGCMFHLAQSFYRKLVDCGLQTQYNSDNALKSWFKRMIALALVPPNDVEDCYELLLDEMYDGLLDKYNSLGVFADYVLKNYIKSESDKAPTFPILLWNHFESEKRTNNDAEGYNARLIKFLRKHPNIWMFILGIAEEESSSTLTCINIEQGKLKNKGRNKVDVERDLHIMTCKYQLSTNQCTLAEYLAKVSTTVPELDEN